MILEMKGQEVGEINEDWWVQDLVSLVETAPHLDQLNLKLQEKIKFLLQCMIT
jgi:hypothetical protein